jgi:murein DD-endopeptidase MepM/ murein hydrolase activator NlpD
LKLKLCLIGLALLVIYVILPSGGIWFNDVELNSQDGRNSQFLSKLSSNEFVAKAAESLNPDIDYIVYPSTAISKNGDNTATGILYLTSGWVRTGSYRTNDIHGALDTDVKGDGTVLIAPVSGVVETVVNNVGYEEDYYMDQIHTSIISIKATGAFEGRSFYIMHLVDIPDYIVPGYEIKQGDYIGTQSAQGRATGSHVHFEVRSGGAKVDISEWFTHLTTHSSITRIEDSTGTPSRSRQGWIEEDVSLFSNNPKYEMEVVVPPQYKTN